MTAPDLIELGPGTTDPDGVLRPPAPPTEVVIDALELPRPAAD